MSQLSLEPEPSFLDSVEIGPMHPDEEAFIASSWKQSAKDAPVNAHAAADVGSFYREYNARVHLTLAAPSIVLVARDKRDHSFAYGWIALLPAKTVCGLAYVYVKNKYRRLGVMKALRDAALSAVSDELPLVYCQKSRFDGTFEHWGMSFMPLREVLEQVKQ